jgi:hypothetical protein
MTAAPKPLPQRVPTPAAPTSVSAKPAARMTLAGITRGKQAQPIRALLYGVEGVGKSTFGANAPSPVFLGAEDGTSQLDVARFHAPESWQDLLEAVQVLTNEPHDFKTLVLDTLDWAEPLLWAHICHRDTTAKSPIRSIEDYGYGKGYSAALDEWRIFLAALERLRKAKGMHVILIAHSWIKSFKNPEGDDFDRYELKLNAKASGLMKEWADAVLFANYETYAVKDAKTKRVRGVSNGARVLYTSRTAAYDAKNRYSLPETLPLSWTDFVGAVANQQPADPTALIAEIERKAKELGGKHEQDALAAIQRANGDAVKLAQLNNWANSKLIEKGS